MSPLSRVWINGHVEPVTVHRMHHHAGRMDAFGVVAGATEAEFSVPVNPWSLMGQEHVFLEADGGSWRLRVLETVLATARGEGHVRAELTDWEEGPVPLTRFPETHPMCRCVPCITASLEETKETMRELLGLDAAALEASIVGADWNYGTATQAQSRVAQASPPRPARQSRRDPPGLRGMSLRGLRP